MLSFKSNVIKRPRFGSYINHCQLCGRSEKLCKSKKVGSRVLCAWCYNKCVRCTSTILYNGVAARDSVGDLVCVSCYKEVTAKGDITRPSRVNLMKP